MKNFVVCYIIARFFVSNVEIRKVGVDTIAWVVDRRLISLWNPEDLLFSILLKL